MTRPLKSKLRRDSYTTRDFYYSYNRKKKTPVPERLFTNVINTFNELAGTEVLTKKKQVFPKIGTFAIRQKHSLNKEGKRIFAIDVLESKNQGKPVIRTNFHTEGKVFYLFWDNNRVLNGKYEIGWYTKTADTMKQKMKRHFMAGNIDYPI